jgi:hypothetical protein
LLGLDLSTVAATQVIAIGLIPFAFAVGVLRGGFARTAALEDLGLWLARGDRDPEAVRGAVAETLGDPDAPARLPDRRRLRRRRRQHG